jgi:hypothetical protein
MELKKLINWLSSKCHGALNMVLIHNDEYFIARRFENIYGRKINLDNPRTFNEKLQYIKLYNHNSILSILADKFAVRDYINNLGLGNYLNDIYGVYNDVKEISLDKLPNSFVIKATHGSGWNILCPDKEMVDWENSSKLMRQWLRTNYYYLQRECCYKNIKPRIIIEKYLGENLIDYKFYCFGGKPKFIQVDIDRFLIHRRNMYDLNWNFIPISYEYDNFESKLINRPRKFEEMIYIVEKLSEKLPFSRVDLYQMNEKVIFGEITLYPGGGFVRYFPDSFDDEWGNLIDVTAFHPSPIQKTIYKAINKFL